MNSAADKWVYVANNVILNEVVMTISIHSVPSPVSSSTGEELLTAKLAKGNQELEGKMALQLIQSAQVNNAPVPTGNSGLQINIKV